jgi:hypothetical protein
MSGQPMSGQPMSGQPFSGQPFSAQPASGQPISGQPISGQPIPGQNPYGQPFQPGQPGQFGQPGQPGQFGQQPGQPATAQFGQPGQPGQFGQQPGQPATAQFGQPGVSGQPGQTGQGVPVPPGWGQPVGQQPGDPVYQPPQDPFQSTTNTPASAQLPYGQPYGQVPGYPTVIEQQPKKKNKGLMITGIVLGVVLLLCAVGGVGAFILLNNNEGKGAGSAQDAAQDFLEAVYKDHNPAAAEKLVCGEARDREAIEAKINQVKDQKGKLKNASIAWDSPKIENETAERADTTVTVKLTTSDEKLAEQILKLTLVKKDGWFVCEVQEQKK